MTSSEFRKLHGLPPPGHDQDNHHHHRLQNPKPQCVPPPALGSSQEGQGGCDDRAIVRITERRVRLLDTDNHTGGCKHLIDCLKANGDIVDDSPKHIKLETDQIQVSHYHEEYIEIEIIKP